jgi:hypothetical protein
VAGLSTRTTNLTVLQLNCSKSQFNHLFHTQGDSHDARYSRRARRHLVLRDLDRRRCQRGGAMSANDVVDVDRLIDAIIAAEALVITEADVDVVAEIRDADELWLHNRSERDAEWLK